MDKTINDSNTFQTDYQLPDAIDSNLAYAYPESMQPDAVGGKARKKMSKAAEKMEKAITGAKRIRDAFRELEDGDSIKIISILKEPPFEKGYLSREKQGRWVKGREIIISSGESTAQKPTYSPKGKAAKSKWREEKFNLRGTLVNRVGKNIWKIRVPIKYEFLAGQAEPMGYEDIEKLLEANKDILEDDGSQIICLGIFSGNEFAFIAHNR